METVSKQQAIASGLKFYFTGKPCKHGHVCERRVSDSACVKCKYKNNKERSLREDVKIKSRDNSKQWYQENKHWKRAVNDQWKRDNREKHNEHSKAAYHRNPESRILSSKKWMKNNPMHVFTRKTLGRLEAKWNPSKYESLLGYTQEEFIAHIESKFKDGMSWERRSEFHIDHIRPVSSFIKQGITDPAIINALSNLQPLWKKENLEKGDKWIYGKEEAQ